MRINWTFKPWEKIEADESMGTDWEQIGLTMGVDWKQIEADNGGRWGANWG